MQKGKIEQGIKLINDLPYNEEDIVIVGDTIHDSDVAEKLKINCVLIDHGMLVEKGLKKLAVKFSQILRILFLIFYNLHTCEIRNLQYIKNINQATSIYVCSKKFNRLKFH